MATAMASSREEQIGDFLFTQDKDHELGFGSYGRVYRGKWVSYTQTVAGKVTSGYKEDLTMEEFQREVDFLRNKIPPHENVVEVFDVVQTEYEEDGVQMVNLWIVTELCEQGDLQKFAQKTKLTIEQKIELMYQSACAVQHLHCCKPESVAHRDIKPQNLLVTGTVDKPIIRLCDFGTAKTIVRKGERSISMKTRTGTEVYWAPEQYEHRHEIFSYDKTVDVFSLGVTFLALLESKKGSPMRGKTGKFCSVLVCGIHLFRWYKQYLLD